MKTFESLVASVSLPKLLVTAAFSGAILTAGAAEALVFDFTYSGGGYSATGEFTTGASGSPYTITGITGMADGSAITGLSGYAGSDQLLYYPASGGYYGDFGGISFETAADVMYNITSYPTGSTNNINVSTLDSGGSGCCVIPVTMSVTLAPVPEPASWAVMLLGLGVLGATLRTARLKTAGSSVL